MFKLLKLFEMYKLNKQKRLNKLNSLNKAIGFTLFELIVVISIFILVSTMILANYPKFSQRMQLNRVAQEVALSLREAQTNALAVREAEIQTDTFPGYGAHFELGKQYKLFADLDQDTIYDSTPSDEATEVFTINTFPSIVSLCAPINDCSKTALDIVYERPDPLITIRDQAGITFTNAKVIVGTSDGTDSKNIIIWVTGQVTIEED